MMKKYYKIIIAILICTACILNWNAIAKASSTAHISFAKSSTCIHSKTKLTLKVKVKNTYKNRRVLYSSSNKNIASVNGNGQVKALKCGTVYISAQIKGVPGKAICKIRIGNYVTGLKVTSAHTVIMDRGKTTQILAATSPSRLLYTGVSYSSADKSIATVDSKGKIKARGKGITKITVSTKGKTSKGKKLSQKVTVIVNDTQETTGSQPVTEEPTTEKPTTDEPTTDKPTTEEPTTEEPTTEEPTTEIEYNDKIPSFDISTLPSKAESGKLVVYKTTAGTGADMKTLYFINKTYSGDITIGIDKYEYSCSKSSNILLTGLQSSIATKVNGSKTICISRYSADDYWRIEELKEQKKYYLKAYLRDTAYYSKYGLIITKGNTLESIDIY